MCKKTKRYYILYEAFTLTEVNEIVKKPVKNYANAREENTRALERLRHFFTLPLLQYKQTLYLRELCE